MLTRISNLLRGSIGAETSIIGWVRTVRQHKKYSFIEVDDGSGHIQVVMDSDKLHTIVTGASVEVKGQLVKGPNTLEIHGTEVKIIGNSDVVGIKLELSISQEISYNGTSKRVCEF